MEFRFTLPGREKELATQFYNLFRLNLTPEFYIAVKLHLKAVFNTFEFYPHIESLNLKSFDKYSDGFFATVDLGFFVEAGEPCPPGTSVYLSYQFNRFRLKISYGGIWVDQSPTDEVTVPSHDFETALDMLASDFNPGRTWGLAFFKTGPVWQKDPAFEFMY